MRAVAVVAGLCAVGAYVLGSLPTAYLTGKRTLRQRLRQLETDGRPLDEQLLALVAGPSSTSWVAVVDAAKVLAAATFTWHAVVAVSPGGTASIPDQSAVAFLSDQVLVSWQSAALWAGLAALVGHLAPAWLGFRGDGGQAPGLALAVVYAPIGFVVGVAAFFAARLALGSHRLAAAVFVGLTSFVGWCWLAWIGDVQRAWGVPAGPESTLWAAVLAGVLAVRTHQAVLGVPDDRSGR